VTLALAGCSSSSPSAPADAAADGPGSDGEAALDAPDGAADARGGTGGTVRGGAGGRGGVGGAGGRGGTGGGASPDAGAGGAPGGPAPPNDTCQTAQAIVLDRARLEVRATTRDANHDLDLSCGAGGRDVFYSFVLTERSLVYADSFGSSFDTIVAFTSACPGAGSDGGAPTGPEPACANDACGTAQSQAVALLPPGKHYLVVSGAAGQAGDFTIHLEHAPSGGGTVGALGPGTASASGATSGGGQIALCEAGGPENSYWWTSCPGFTGGPFMASTCSSTAYDTMLSLQIPRTGALVCNDDACNLQAAMTTNLPPGAGLHVLAVDGFTTRQQGTYTLNTVRP
jgi:hypothetical protein